MLVLDGEDGLTHISSYKLPDNLNEIQKSEMPRSSLQANYGKNMSGFHEILINQSWNANDITKDSYQTIIMSYEKNLISRNPRELNMEIS